jgi:hypothetical protein
MNDEFWTKDKFSRRRYTVEGGDLDKARKIELIVKVDGKPIVQVQAREPGIIAFVSKPVEQGFDIEIVEAVNRQYFDRAVPDSSQEGVTGWQLEALGLVGIESAHE